MCFDDASDKLGEKETTGHEKTYHHRCLYFKKVQITKRRVSVALT